MPIVPPVFDAPHAFEPRFVTADDVEDLSTYSGMTPKACLERLHSYSPNELAEAWHRTNPTTTHEILQFYRTTDLYVWDLMQWHASPARRSYWEALTTFATKFGPEAGYRTVYDFGCGVGTDALFLASRGYRVTAVDVDGPAFRFAQHRFERRGMRASFIKSDSALPRPNGIFDAVVCFDVFEHLDDPLKAAGVLVNALRPGGILAQTGSFEDAGVHPCHLANGVQRFGGIKWHIHLAGLGLRHETSLLYRKEWASVGLVQRIRFWLWRATGFWLIRPGGPHG